MELDSKIKPLCIAFGVDIILKYQIVLKLFFLNYECLYFDCNEKIARFVIGTKFEGFGVGEFTIFRE